MHSRQFALWELPYLQQQQQDDCLKASDWKGEPQITISSERCTLQRV